MKTKCLIIAQYDFTNKKGKHIQSGKGLIDFGVYGSIEVIDKKLYGHKLFEEIDVSINVDEYGKIIIEN